MSSDARKRRKKALKKVPPEIRAVRREREKRRLMAAAIVWLVWLAFMIAGLIAPDPAGTVLLAIACAASLTSWAISTAMYESTLRKIAGRPQVDYARIAKTEKQLGIGSHRRDNA